MNEISQPPRPTLQPASIHGTPHPHHGYLHLVVGLLGVLLVLETIVFGYVITQYADLQNEQEALLEKRAAVAAIKDAEPVVRTEKQCSETMLSNLVFNPASRDLDATNLSTTWLQNQLSKQGDSCLYAAEQLKGAQPVNGGGPGITSAELSDAGIIAALGASASDQGMKNLGMLLDDEQKRLFKICQGKDDVHVILLDASYRHQAILSYDQTYSAWIPAQPVGDVIDGAIRLFPDFFGNGVPLVATGYGDAGFNSWKYWAITDYGSTQLLENCVTGTGLTGYLESEGLKLVCKVEYVP